MMEVIVGLSASFTHLDDDRGSTKSVFVTLSPFFYVIFLSLSAAYHWVFIRFLTTHVALIKAILMSCSVTSRVMLCDFTHKVT
jgi:hypothetical protein